MAHPRADRAGRPAPVAQLAPPFARGGGPPQFALARLVLAQSPERIAPLLGHRPQTLAARLSDQGIAITDPARPLGAAAPPADEATLAAALLAAANRGAQPD